MIKILRLELKRVNGSEGRERYELKEQECSFLVVFSPSAYSANEIIDIRNVML